MVVGLSQGNFLLPSDPPSLSPNNPVPPTLQHHLQRPPQKGLKVVTKRHPQGIAPSLLQPPQSRPAHAGRGDAGVLSRSQEGKPQTVHPATQPRKHLTEPVEGKMSQQTQTGVRILPSLPRLQGQVQPPSPDHPIPNDRFPLKKHYPSLTI